MPNINKLIKINTLINEMSNDGGILKLYFRKRSNGQFRSVNAKLPNRLRNYHEDVARAATNLGNGLKLMFDVDVEEFKTIPLDTLISIEKDGVKVDVN